MGTKIQGLKWLVYASTAVVALGSERSVSIEINSNVVDTSDKSNSGWGDALATIRTMKINFNGDFINQNTNGWDAIEDAAFGGTTVALKVRDTVNHRQYFGTFNVDTFKLDAAHDNVVKVDAACSNVGTAYRSTY